MTIVNIGVGEPRVLIARSRGFLTAVLTDFGKDFNATSQAEESHKVQKVVSQSVI